MCGSDLTKGGGPVNPGTLVPNLLPIRGGRRGITGPVRPRPIACASAPARSACRPRRSVGLGEPEPDGDGGGLDTSRNVQLVEDLADVNADGLLADEQVLADLAVRPPLREQRQNLPLPTGQTERVRLVRG